MSQTLTFAKAVQQLYYNVNIKDTSADTVIDAFDKVAHEHRLGGVMSSLAINLAMEMNGKVRKVSHVFSFIKGPIPGATADTGYIKVGVGESGSIKRIIEIEWCFQFLHQEDAEVFFDKLVAIFRPLSTKQAIGDDELNSGKYAEFSTRDKNETGIRDVTFFFGKSLEGKYEVRFFPYNEFMD